MKDQDAYREVELPEGYTWAIMTYNDRKYLYVEVWFEDRMLFKSIARDKEELAAQAFAHAAAHKNNVSKESESK